MEMMPALIHCQVDLLAQALDGHRMPVLVIQQAAQGESDQGMTREQFSFT
jgi:hypothetical protein